MSPDDLDTTKQPPNNVPTDNIKQPGAGTSHTETGSPAPVDAQQTRAAAQQPTAAKPPAPPESKFKLFMTSLPGVLTAVGGTIAAVSALLAALNSADWLRKPEPTATPAPTAAFTATVTLVPASPTPQPTATMAPTTVPTVAPTTADMGAFFDSFDGPEQAWETFVEPEYSLSYKDGEYRVMVNVPYLSLWGSPLKEYDMPNVRVEVEARQLAGGSDSFYGIVTRDMGEARFYLFALSDDGTYCILRSYGEEYVRLMEWTESTAIQRGGGVNRMRAECLGSTLRFYVNDEFLAEVKDESYASGKIGLLAGTDDQSTMEVRFDNVQVSVLRGF